MNDNEVLPFREVYKCFWERYNTELSHFWQRAVFLGTFLALAYTGYGALCVKAFDIQQPLDWNLFHLVMCGIACLGMFLSALWVLMAKGSKAWYEYYEAAIGALNDRMPVVRGNNNRTAVFHAEEVAALNIHRCPEFATHWKRLAHDESYFSCAAGPFSTSKCVVFLGSFSLSIWLVLVTMHGLALLFGREETVVFVRVYAPELAVVLVGITIAVIFFWLRRLLSSGVLSELNKSV